MSTKETITRLPVETTYAETYLIHLAENRPDLLRCLMKDKTELVNIVTQQWMRAWEIRQSMEANGSNEFEVAEYVNNFLAPPEEITYDDVEIVEQEELRVLIDELAIIQKKQYKNK